MINLLIIPYMAVMAAWSGGSLWPSQYLPKRITWLPEAFFALGVVYALWPILGPWSLLAGAWSYAWQQSATGPALQWGRDPVHAMARPRRLSPVINFISDRLGFERGDVNYCRTWMAVKGFLITLPVGGIVGAVLWPLGYEVGHRVGRHVVSELLSGAGAGVAIVLFMILTV